MPPEAELALLRTAQEALVNVARHSQATGAWLTLSYMEHEVALDVRDNGRGFDPAQLGDNVAGNEAAAGPDPAFEVLGEAADGAEAVRLAGPSSLT